MAVLKQNVKTFKGFSQVCKVLKLVSYQRSATSSSHTCGRLRPKKKKLQVIQQEGPTMSKEKPSLS